MKCCKGFGSSVVCILSVAFITGVLTALLFPLRFLLLVASVCVITLGLMALTK